MDTLRSEAMDRLFEVILSLKDVDECYAFFEDLCTVKELKDLSQRLDVARFLNQNLRYQEVAARTTVSSATISRVKKCLDYGTGGYKMVLQRLGEEA